MYDGAVSTIRPNCRWLDVPRAILVAASPDAGPVKGFAYYHDICPARREPRSDKAGMFLHGGENGGVNTLILAEGPPQPFAAALRIPFLVGTTAFSVARVRPTSPSPMVVLSQDSKASIWGWRILFRHHRSCSHCWHSGYCLDKVDRKGSSSAGAPSRSRRSAV